MLALNAADSIYNVSGTLPGIPSGNFAGRALRPMLRDVGARDFRPVAGSALEQAGAGAYRIGEAYWVPGPWARRGVRTRRASPTATPSSPSGLRKSIGYWIGRLRLGRRV